MSVVAPFLDQSLDFASGIGQLTGGQSQASKQMMLKDKTNINNLPSAALQQDINRPKTSTGLRGSGTFNRITDDQPVTGQSVTNMQQVHTGMTTINSLPTKQAAKNPSTFSGKMEKQDLRQQLRRSFDANAPSQKASQGREALIQNRPHSSHKQSNSMVKPTTGSATNGQI